MAPSSARSLRLRWAFARQREPLSFNPLKSHPHISQLKAHASNTINQTTLPLPLKHLAARIPLAILASILSVTLSAQQPRTIIFLDPAHGGPDPGAHLPNNLLEKDLTLAFATRLRAQLSAANFAVISTRDADPTVPFPTDQRAEIANHAHPAACLILHATSSGTGVHLVTSALTPNDLDDPHAPIPWNTAQSASVAQSLTLANEIGLSLQRAKLPVILSQASIRPVDNLTCPAIALEIAPLGAGDNQTPITDANYQQNIAKAITDALTNWRTRQQAAAGGAQK